MSESEYFNRMIKRVLLLLFLLVFYFQPTSGQTTVNHWETVVYDSMMWRYFVGTSDPGSDWFQPGFDDSAWQQGRGSIGYGDNDDRTIISNTLSVFLRKKFTITNKDKIVGAILHMDYDDGFIAYLNGVEIARAMMGDDDMVPFNQPSSGLHEALLYQGFAPESILLDPELMDQLLINGENTLAFQVHNENISSSDLTASLFFTVGISDNSFTYLPTPSWFIEPLDFQSSNLPIIVINTSGQQIADEPRIVADMGIIDNGTGNRNSVTDAFNNYNGKIAIEIRGESSQMFPKKSYRIETQDETGNNLNVSLLGMPSENDWVLYAPYSDKSLMRNSLTFKLGRDMGRYAPRNRFVELVLNGNYEGVYVLMEKIKVDNNRVDIAGLDPEDISGRDVTGGYLLRVDKIDADDYPAWSATPDPLPTGFRDVTFQYEDPNGEDLMPQQRSYISNYMYEFQSSLTRASFTDMATGYKSYLDMSAAIDFMLVNEIGKNVDAYIFSTYLYKEKDPQNGRGKLVMGPLWDFNLAYGNVDYHANSQFSPGWMYNDDYRMYWFRRMMQDPYFAASFTCRWEQLRSTWLTDAYVNQAIDSMVTLLSEAQVRNFQRWPVLGVYVWPNQFIGQTYEQEINWMKRWIEDRLFWMDTNKPGDCSIITSIDEVDKSGAFTLYPNPTERSVTITLNTEAGGSKQLRIFNLTGQLVYQTQFTGESFIWPGLTQSGDELAAGVYVVTITDERGASIQQKLIRR
jgi:hypothetical protein